jgi:hypothetical protein
MDDGRRLAAQFQHAGHHVRAAAVAMAMPGGTEPVKTIWFDAGMAGERRAGLMAQPAETLTAPGGRPAASAARATRCCQRVSSGVLTTQALPVASAADSERAVISSG